MKQLRAFLLLTILCLLLAASGCGKAPDRKIWYFYEEVCAACDVPGEFRALFSQKTGDLSLPEESIPTVCNVFSQGGEETWRTLCQERGIPEEGQTLPMVVTSAGWASGEDIAPNLRRLVCQSLGLADDRTYTYYYRPDCGDCVRSDPVVEAAFAARPELSLISIDTTDLEPKAAFKALLTEMQVPEEEWQVPFLLCNDRCLSGVDAILENLPDFLNP